MLACCALRLLHVVAHVALAAQFARVLHKYKRVLASTHIDLLFEQPRTNIKAPSTHQATESISPMRAPEVVVVVVHSVVVMVFMLFGGLLMRKSELISTIPILQPWHTRGG